VTGTQPARFLLAWIVPVFIAFSLVSGKQIKYLLPLLPAFALLGGYALYRAGEQHGRPLFATLTVAVVGLLLTALPFAIRPDNAYWLQAISPWWGVGLLVAAAGLMLLRTPGPLASARVLAVASALIVITAHLGVVRIGAQAYDLHAISTRIEQLQSDGHQVAHVGKYHGQFHFLGRLTQPITVVEQWNGSAVDWARAHPSDYLVVYRSDWAGLGAGALYSQPFRSTRDELTLWQAAAWLQALRQAGISTEE
jgi:4-amino-4-deoxy-L-arabinose transferase-like glycosyltransferase